MDLVTLPDVAGADEYLGCARCIDVNGARVRGRVRCVGPLCGEVQRILSHGGVAVRRRHHAVGPDSPVVGGAVAPGEGPVVVGRVRRWGDRDSGTERNGLAGLGPHVGADVDLRSPSGRRRTTRLGLTRGGPDGESSHHAQHRYACVSHVVLSMSIKARAAGASGGSRNRLRPPMQDPMVVRVRPMIRTSTGSEAWRTYTTSSATLSGSRRSTYAVSGSPPASSASPCV